MNTLLQKNDPAAIGKLIMASSQVDYHSTPAISPTGYSVGAWSRIGTLQAFVDGTDGQTWVQVEEGGETLYLLFIPGSYYILEGAEYKALNFLQKPVNVFVTIALGSILLALGMGFVVWNLATKKNA